MISIAGFCIRTAKSSLLAPMVLNLRLAFLLSISTSLLLGVSFSRLRSRSYSSDSRMSKLLCFTCVQKSPLSSNSLFMSSKSPKENYPSSCSLSPLPEAYSYFCSIISYTQLVFICWTYLFYSTFSFYSFSFCYLIPLPNLSIYLSMAL